MAKIKLDLEQLEVETFGTDEAGEPRGTVHGAEFTVGLDCRTAQSGNPDCFGCQVSGVASCVWCSPDTGTCQDCSWTFGDGAQCYW